MKRERVGIIENILRSGMRLKPAMPLYARVSFINAISLLCTLLFGVFGLGNYLAGAETFALFEFALALAFVFSMLVMRLTARTGPSALINSVLIYIGSAVLVITGGTGGTGIYWIMICPLLFLNFWGRKLGLVWLMGQLVIVLSLVALNTTGFIYVDYTPYEMLVFTASLMIFSLLLWTHDYLENLKLKYLGHE